MRVGIGYDVHIFVPGRSLYLGGVYIPHDAGLLGHSDGDVLIHAISDALLGAAAENDIGFHFPDTDESTEGMESSVILARTIGIVRSKGYEVENIDSIVVCETPKIASYREQIRERLAQIMGIDMTRVGVKGKTTERLGFTGRKEGIAAYATCLLRSVETHG